MGLSADLKYGLRLLRRSPGFSIAAVIVLALGIGANTAMFTVVNALLLRQLPFDRSDQITMVLDSRPARNQHRNVISPADYLDWKARSKSFEHLAAWNFARWTLTGFGAAEELKTHVVSREFFDVLRVQPLLGRPFTAEEDRPGGQSAAIISYGLWQKRLGGRPDVLGKKLTLDNQPVTVVGVMPQDFVFMDREIDLWLAMQLNPANNYRVGSGRFMYSVGRLREGVTPDAAQREMAAIAATLEREYPEFHKGWSVDVIPLREYMVGDTRLTLIMLMGAVAMVLLIACANVASLVLARATARAREIAVRMSVGGSRWDIVRQLLAESLLLSVAGGIAGIAFSFWITEVLIAMAPRTLQISASFRPDWTVLAFAVLVSLLTGVLSGLAPALQSLRTDPIRALHGAGRTHGSGGSGVRSVLVVAEVALSVILLAGAGLLLRSLDALHNRNVGLDARGVASMRITLPRESYDTPEKRIQFTKRALERIRSLPGVESATTSTFLPGTAMISGTGFLIVGKPEPKPGERLSTKVTAVDPDFFKTLRVRLLSGRLFEERDNKPGEPGLFVVNESFAKAAFPGESAVGKRIQVRMGGTDIGEIIGVVADVRHTGLAQPMAPVAYYVNSKLPSALIHFLVRGKSEDPGTVTTAAMRAIESLDPTVAIADVKPLESVLAESVARIRFTTVLLSVFSGFALLLAGFGLYSLLSWIVARRTSEIGVRMALGARPADVLRLTMGQGLRLVAVGLVTGLAASALLVQFVQSMLFDVKPADPVAWTVVPAVLALFSVAALTAPAVRASRLQPVS